MPEGERNLGVLLRTMEPRLAPGDYVFRTFLHGEGPPPGAIGTFREAEGWSAILRLDTVDPEGRSGAGSFRLITLEVHSSLQAVGLLAAVSTALARAGIACNVVSAFYHDHLFVPAAAAERALAVLRTLSRAESEARE